MRSLPIVALALSAVLTSAPAQTTHTLTTGSGPGSISVTVDGMGGYGGCFSANGLSDLSFEDGTVSRLTTCGSALLYHDPSGTTGNSLPVALVSYTSGGFPVGLAAPTIQVNVPGQDIQATFTNGPFSITCRQIVSGPDPAGGPIIEGSTLTQIYEITNNDPSFANHTLDFARWVDGDVIATSGDFTDDYAGATADQATAGGPLPLTGNGHVVFQYDINLNYVMMISLDVVTDTGLPRENDRWEAIDNTGAGAWAPMGSAAASGLLNTVSTDGNGDLLQDVGIDSAMGLGVTQVVLQPTLTTRVVTRTRLSFMDSTSPAPPHLQARALTGTAFNGTYPGAGTAAVAPLLCVNGVGTVAPVPAGAPITVGLAPPAGLTSSLYMLQVAVGNPITGNPCGVARTLDYAFWGSPVGLLGTGAFPTTITSFGLQFTGGGATAGVTLASNFPGLGLLSAPSASSAIPCGGPIVGPFVVGQSLAFTVQSLQTDPTSITGLSLSNAVAVAVGNCPTPTR